MKSTIDVYQAKWTRCWNSFSSPASMTDITKYKPHGKFRTTFVSNILVEHISENK